MAKKTTVGIYEQDLSRFNVLTFATHKEQTDLMHVLCTELENALKDSIALHAKNGNISFQWQLVTKRTGLTLQLTFVPKLAVQTKESIPVTARYSKEGKFKGVVK
jgi:hypothetical protein